MQSFPSPKLLYTEHLQRLAFHYPDKVAAIDDGGELTYSALWTAVVAASGALRARGVRKGDRLATAMVPSLTHLVVILAAMASGAVPCPLNIRLTAPEFRGFLTPIAPAAIVADPENAAAVGELGVEVIVLHGAGARTDIRSRLHPLWSDTPWTAPLQEEDFALIIPTGGTTGVPKGAVSSHRGVYLWLASCAFDWRAARDTELFFSPFFHASILSGWMATLFAAGTVRILRGFSPDRALEAIGQGATTLMGAPTMFAALKMHSDFERTDRSRISALNVGSMATGSDTIRELLADYPGARLRHSYGATEFGPVTVFEHEDFLAGRTEGVGRAQLGCRVTVVDEQLRPLPAGGLGELVATSPWQTVGYWGREEETAATYTSLGVRLGDLGVMDASGWITIAGRKKEMIVSGGENIFPNEVEAVLRRHPAVADISVYGVKDSYWGERVEAAVVLRPGADLTSAELSAFGRAELGSYKLPKSLRVLEMIPLTANNKPDRARLAREAG